MANRALLFGALFLVSLSYAVKAEAAKPATEKPFTIGDTDTEINGLKVIELARPRNTQLEEPQILSVQIIPGRGMNIFQMKAYVPGLGVIEMLDSPSLRSAARRMSGGPSDFNGNQSFLMGGAILAPFAGRIRGTDYDAKGKTIMADILGKKIKLPANWKGKFPTAEAHAIHGLLLDKKMHSLSRKANNEEASLAARYSAGNFGGHWFWSTTLKFLARLTAQGFSLEVTAINTGKQNVPVGIGWHPAFRIPSGERAPARLHVPAANRLLTDDYDNLFPLGSRVPTDGSTYDFSMAKGNQLGTLLLDETFVDLKPNDSGVIEVRLIDTQAPYGVRVKAISPEIKAIQIYSPSSKEAVAIEPQFNYPDPFGHVWKDKGDTGMIVLKPGEQVKYHVEVELFNPKK